MPDRTKLLVHLRRLSNLLDSAIRNGPDGALEGKFAGEHPAFVHHACAFYLIGCFAYLEGENGPYSWDIPSATHPDFDSFALAFPKTPKASFHARGIHSVALRALANVRNAVAHHDGDLAKLMRARKTDVLAEVELGSLPGVVLTGSIVTLEAPCLEFVRVATLAARNYQGEF
jgi:hypothetical protein